MYLFKTAGATFDSVIKHQKHASKGKPRDWYPGEIILVSKTKKDCAKGERPIAYTMRISEVRLVSNDEIALYWPGNNDRWKYIIECTGTEPIPVPFSLEEVLGDDAKHYGNVLNFAKIKPEHETLILPLLTASTFNATDEVSETQSYVEGASCTVVVNAFERDSAARKACLDHYGCNCRVCGFNFEETFGALGKGYIHVHHKVPLADIRQEYKVNPLTDLIPLCANCHAMIHRRRPTLTLEELIGSMEKKNEGA